MIKYHKAIIAFFIGGIFMSLTGCTSPQSLVKAMSDSNRTIHVKVTSIYGTITVTGTNPQTNQSATVTDSGAVSVISNK